MPLLRSRGAALVVGLARQFSRRETVVRSTVRAIDTRMGRLLAEVEERAWADARPCPICRAYSAEMTDALPHAPDCELDAVLVEAGARSHR